MASAAAAGVEEQQQQQLPAVAAAEQEEDDDEDDDDNPFARRVALSRCRRARHRPQAPAGCPSFSTIFVESAETTV